MTTPRQYAGYVDCHYLELAAQIPQWDEERTYVAMQVACVQIVLDVGYGPGLDTGALAALAGGAGEVVGVDQDAAMVAEAGRRTAESGVAERVRHLVADAGALPLPPATFDACRSERLSQHLDDPLAALTEMVRVTRPGGWVVALDIDYSSLTFDSGEDDIEPRLACFTAQRLRNGYAARRLYRLVKWHGLAQASLEVYPQLSFSAALAHIGWLDNAERDVLAAGIITASELARCHVCALSFVSSAQSAHFWPLSGQPPHR